MESIICKLATGEISIFQLVSVAEETGLSLALSGTPKTGFLTTRPINISGDDSELPQVAPFYWIPGISDV